MKKIVFLSLLMGFFLVHPLAFGEEVSDCTALLSENATEEDWRLQYMVADQNNLIWQRALLSKPQENIVLQEGETIRIEGQAEANASVQIYLFSKKEGEQGIIEPPSENGTCFSKKADKSGFFQIEVGPEILWTRMGKKILIDSFYQTNEHWEQQTEEDIQAFGIGTGNMLKTFSVKVDLGEKNATGCSTVCDFGITLGAELNPEDTENGIDQKFIESFSAIDYMPVTIGRKPGENTFYGKTEYENADPYTLQDISVQAVLLEGVKRVLLGNKNFGGELLTALKEEDIADPEAIKNALTGDYSSEIKTLLGTIKTMLTENKSEAERSTLAQQILDALKVAALKEPGAQEALLRNMLELFPNNVSTDEEWSHDFVQLLKFWTNSTEQNACLVADDEHYYYNFSHVGSTGFANFNAGFDLCDFIFVEGIDPTLLIRNKNITTVRPDFQEDVRISIANRFFNTKNEWTFSPQEEKKIQYGYQFSQAPQVHGVLNACVPGKKVSELVTNLSDSFSLSQEERNVLTQELLALTPDENTYYSLTLKDPQSIANLFSWKGNGMALKTLQLFFSVKPGACFSASVGEISDSAQVFWEPLRSERDAFETGIFMQ